MSQVAPVRDEQVEEVTPSGGTDFGSSKSGPTKLQRAVYQFIAGRLPIADVSVHRYGIEGSFSEKYWVASGALQNTKSALLSVSLPELSHTVFLCISGGLKPVFEQLVCEINANSECNDAYQAGHAHRLQDHPLNRFGWAGVLFVSAHDYFSKIPEMLNIGGEVFDFVLVIPISAAEYDIWVTQGYDALRQLFAQHKRGLLDGHRRLALVSSERPNTATKTPSGDEPSASRSRLKASTKSPGRAATQVQSVAPSQGDFFGGKQQPELDHAELSPANLPQWANLEADDARHAEALMADQDVDPDYTPQPNQPTEHQLVSLKALEQYAQYVAWGKKAAIGALGLMGVLGVTAMGLLPAVFAGAGVLVLAGALKDLKQEA